MKKRLFAGSLAMVLAAGMLTGCSIELPFSQPKTAEGVVERYLEKKYDNYSTEAKMEVEMEMAAKGINMEIPISVDLSADMDGDKAHGKMALEASFMGQSTDEETEFYVDGKHTYMPVSKGSDDFYENTTNFNVEAFTNSVSTAKAFEKAEMEKKDDAYVITGKMEDLMGDSEFLDSLFSETTGDIASIDAEELTKQIGKAEVVYKFNTKDYRLLSVEIKDAKSEASTEENGMEVRISMALNGTFEYSNYGEVDKDDVKLPKKANIVSAPGSTDGSIADLVEDSEKEAADGGSTGDITKIVDSHLGSYNGTSFTTPFSISAIEKDGWTRDPAEDGAYSFIALENKKYPSATFYVYDKSNKGNYNDIAANGSYGFSLEARDKSDLTALAKVADFNGVSFGSSYNDVIKIYGKSNSSYNSGSYKTIDYELSDGSTFTFTFTDDVLTGAELFVYTY